MITATDIEEELADHIPDQAGEDPPGAPFVSTIRGISGGDRVVPESVTGEVVLRVVESEDGGIIGWETTTPESLADKIENIDNGEVAESEAFSRDYLTKWREEGRQI